MSETLAGTLKRLGYELLTLSVNPHSTEAPERLKAITEELKRLLTRKEGE